MKVVQLLSLCFIPQTLRGNRLEISASSSIYCSSVSVFLLVAPFTFRLSAWLHTGANVTAAILSRARSGKKKRNWWYQSVNLFQFNLSARHIYSSYTTEKTWDKLDFLTLSKSTHTMVHSHGSVHQDSHHPACTTKDLYAFHTMCWVQIQFGPQSLFRLNLLWDVPKWTENDVEQTLLSLLPPQPSSSRK